MQRLLSTSRIKAKVVPLNGEKKGRHEELTRSNLFCPHFLRGESVMSLELLILSHYDIRFSRSDEKWRSVAPGPIYLENRLRLSFL